MDILFLYIHTYIPARGSSAPRTLEIPGMVLVVLFCVRTPLEVSSWFTAKTSS